MLCSPSSQPADQAVPLPGRGGHWVYVQLAAPSQAAVSTASWPGQEGPVHIGDQETRGEDVLPHQKKDREERTQEKDPQDSDAIK